MVAVVRDAVGRPAGSLLLERDGVWGYRFTQALINASFVSTTPRLELARSHARNAVTLGKGAAADLSLNAEIAHISTPPDRSVTWPEQWSGHVAPPKVRNVIRL